MTSKRLPGKVLLPFLGKPSLELMIERIRYSRYIDEIVVATTENKTDDPIIELCERLGVTIFRGSEEDVLSRVLGAAKSVGSDYICELTGDCPLIDPLIIDQVIISHLSGKFDYTSNCLNQRTFPLGLDVQVFGSDVLQRVSDLTDDAIDRVHVSCFIYNNPKLFNLNGITADPQTFGPDIRITIDTEEDYELIGKIFEALYKDKRIFYAKDIVSWLRKNAHLLQINKHIMQKALEEG
jgi:spore coat polysaccharide biosynthesis protein SpsF